MNIKYILIVALLLCTSNSYSKENLTELERENPDAKYKTHTPRNNNYSDPCEDIRREAYRYMNYSKLLSLAEEDMDFFMKCDLWGALRSNTRRSEEEKQKGLKLLTKLADQGNAEVQYDLAIEYSMYPGRGEMRLGKDMNKFFKYMKMAANQNYSDSYRQVAEGYNHLREYENSKIWLEKALVNETDQKQLSAIRWDLGQRYEKGIGVQKDLDKALNFYKTAARLATDSHYYEYYFRLGVWLYEGSGSFSKDRGLGLEYLRKAARSGTITRAENYCKENGIPF